MSCTYGFFSPLGLSAVRVVGFTSCPGLSLREQKAMGGGGDCHSRGEMIITRTARSKQMNRMTTEYSVGLASEVDKTIANDPQKFPFLILHLLDCIFLRSELEDT